MSVIYLGQDKPPYEFWGLFNFESLDEVDETGAWFETCTMLKDIPSWKIKKGDVFDEVFLFFHYPKLHFYKEPNELFAKVLFSAIL